MDGEDEDDNGPSRKWMSGSGVMALPPEER